MAQELDADEGENVDPREVKRIVEETKRFPPSTETVETTETTTTTTTPA